MHRFDALFAEAEPLVLTQQHHRDGPPTEGGRWPVSVVLPPPPTTAALLAGLTDDALRLAGPGHFRTGSLGSAHFTVRALEGYREDIAATDVAVGRYRSAVGRTARACRPVTVQLRGLTLTRSGVIVCGWPSDEAASVLISSLAAELGPDGHREADFERDIWYATLVHFAGPLSHPQSLVEWVRQHRETDFGACRLEAVQLVRFRYAAGVGGQAPVMRPEILQHTPFTH